MCSRQEWSRAFAAQAKADLGSHDALLENSGQLRLPRCQELHFLQMAAEKLSKAYRLASGGATLESVQESHAYAAKALPILFRAAASASGAKPNKGSWEVEAVRKLAREIDLLHPANKDGGARPDNTEYPWVDGRGSLRTPCEWKFEGLSALYGPGIGVKLKKILRSSIAAQTDAAK